MSSRTADGTSAGAVERPVGPVRTHADHQGRRYFGELDGLRAVAILLVFTSHVDALFWDRLHGGTGVTVFFVLSGFLITTLARREERTRGRLDIRGFYLRRVFRIYPLYVAVLAFYATLILVLGFQPERRGAFLDSLPFYLGFLPEQALLNSTGVEPPFAAAWSLGIEEKFYFVWPLLGFWLLAGRFRLRVWALVAAVVACWAMPLVLDPIGYLVQPYALIGMGCVLALLLDDERGYAVVSRLGRPPVLGAVLVVVLALQLATSEIELTRPLYVAFGIPVALLLAGLLTSTGRLPALLRSRPLVFLGRISYAFYLTHGFALNLVQAVLPATGFWQGVVAPAVGLATAVLGAWILHVCLEKPMIRLGHRLGDRPGSHRRLPVA